MNHKTPFDKEYNPNNYNYVQKNMMVDHNYIWDTSEENSKENGDALWRTGWAYIAYGDKCLRKGILSCFTNEIDKKGKPYIQAYRYPNFKSENVSRDQIISALCGLKINNDIEDMKRIIKGLRWKISKKFQLTPDTWMWMQALKGSLFWSIMFCFIDMIFVAPWSVLYDKFLYKWTGLTQVSPEEKVGDINVEANKKQKFAMNVHYPMYARHLFAWQLYTTRNNPFKWICKKCLLIGLHESNFLMKLLAGKKIKLSDVYHYKPMTGFPWQEMYFKHIYSACEIIALHSEYKKMYENKANVLDSDILWYMYEKHPELFINDID
jgi:hypothetical protein